jgi:Zn-dependent peptidase ImmA (M78 family)
MKLIVNKIKSLAFGWNERPLTESDFYRLCKRFQIRVTEMPLATGGFYYRVKGRDFIAISSRLAGSKRLFVMFHELGHFLLHVPDGGVTANFHGVGRRTRKEREADMFALCALIPKSFIEHGADPAELGLDDELAAERLDLYTERGI